MKIDLKRLKEVEESFETKELSSYALKSMVSSVLEYDRASSNICPTHVQIAINTLSELRILISDDKDKKEPQLLKS